MGAQARPRFIQGIFSIRIGRLQRIDSGVEIIQFSRRLYFIYFELRGAAFFFKVQPLQVSESK